MSESKFGKIVTFYSYKGGVGRTFALTNIGIYLATIGKRVLVMDWDLEAPGMEYFFGQLPSWPGLREGAGVLPMLNSCGNDPNTFWKDHVISLKIPTGHIIDFIPSGSHSPGYAKQLRDFSWKDFFSAQHRGPALEKMRNEWLSVYDFILIDSRTGITEIGGVCTILLPDLIAGVFTASDQSLSGLISVIESANKERDSLAIPRPELAILPILSRFDGGNESKLSEQWLTKSAAKLKPYFDVWLQQPFEDTIKHFLGATRIPHVPRYTFGEPLAVLDDDWNPDFAGKYFKIHAELIANSLNNALVIADLPNKEGSLTTSITPDQKTQRVTPNSTHAPQVADKNFRFLVAFSFAGAHRNKVRAIAESVATRMGRDNVFFDEWYEDELGGDEAEVELQNIYEKRSMLVIADVSGKYSDRPWCQAEASAIRAFRMGLDSARKPADRLRLAYIRFDDSDIPGVLRNAITWDGIKKTEVELADLICSRLTKLQKELGETSKPPPTPVSVTPPTPTIPIRFFHPATNDEYYTKREAELAWLDSCARDTQIRLATVTGIGGLGKTSLVGHWLQKHEGWRLRNFRGVFFYSFYSDKQPQSFFAALLAFICEVEGITQIPANAPLHQLTAHALRRWSYLVVLDGLEVIQQNENDPHYGWIDDSELNEFVRRISEGGTSLLVLTSRFPFPQVTDLHPESARALELPMLEEMDGAALLEKCGLMDSLPQRRAFSAQFGGHPLGLRLFAGACQATPFSDPTEVSQFLLHDPSAETTLDPDAPGLSETERQRRKQFRQFYHLLAWFQKKLPPAKRRLLQIVSLFKEPVSTKTILALAKGLEAMKADFITCDDADLLSLLHELMEDHLLQQEGNGSTETIAWTAHPIVRDVFREMALKEGGDIAKQFSEIVTGSDNGVMHSAAEGLQPILEAIEVLLQAGDFRSADELYRWNLLNGRVFLSIPAPQEGLRCARGFLEPSTRRQELEKKLGIENVAFYLNEQALWGNILGEMDDVERILKELTAIQIHVQDVANLCIGLMNLCDTQTLLGTLTEAISSANSALFYEEANSSFAASECSNSPSTRSVLLLTPSSEIQSFSAKGSKDSLARKANALSLAGQLQAASADFCVANALYRKQVGQNTNLYGLLGINWARHRQRLGELDPVRNVTLVNRITCAGNTWNADLARCDLLLGELDLQQGALDSAESQIDQALQVFRKAHQGKDLPDALLAMARVRHLKGAGASRLRVPTDSAIREGETPSPLAALTSEDAALTTCNEALTMARRSGFRLKICDILNFRSLVYREANQLTQATADAREALAIATECHYYWGRHEALRQLIACLNAEEKTAEVAEWIKAEAELTAHMKPLIEEALKINQAHDLEMERLYGKK